MIEASPCDWLEQEVRDHLNDFGIIGLYELRWLLNGSDFQLDLDQVGRISCLVAQRVLKFEGVALFTVTWPEMRVISVELPGSVLSSSDSWESSFDGSFVALTSG